MEPAVDVLAEVTDFVSDRIGVRRRGLTPESTLRFDLGIDGNVAVVFLDAFRERFGVDMSALRFHRYFRDDKKIYLLSPLLEGALLVWRRVAHRLGLYDPGTQITLHDLAVAATVGRWPEH